MPGSGAILSDDGVYRYALTRQWSPGKVCAWVMLNPSTADAHEDDATIRRCIGFSKAWGFGGLTVVNLFAYRATDPRELDRLDREGIVSIIGPGNDEYIAAAARDRLTVLAWGAHPLVRLRAQPVIDLVTDSGATVACLGLTARGHPLHPVRLPKSRVPLNPITLAPLALGEV